MRIEVQGLDRADAHLSQIIEELQGSRGTVYHDIGEIVDDSILANFAAEGRPKWAPRKKEYAWKSLNKTGRMGGRSLEDTQHWEHLVRVHRLNIRSTFYGKFHQFGTSRLPIRKFVQLTPEEQEQVKSRLRRIFD